MDKKIFFALMGVCIITHIVRSIYEILKHKKIVKPGKLSFVIVFTNMMILWISWIALCSRHIYTIHIGGTLRLVGFCICAAGMIVFLIALFTIKSLESYDGELISTGIYSKIRHPMYLGFILWLIGFPLLFETIYLLFLSIVFIANVLFWKSLEEKELMERFDTYMDYKKKTLF